MKTIALTLLLFVNVSVVSFSQTISSIRLSPDSVSREMFTDGQLAGIADMIAYVDEFVCKKTGVQNAVEAYPIFFNSWYDTVAKNNGSVEQYRQFCIPLNDKMDFLQALDSLTFLAFFRKDDLIPKLRWDDTLLVAVNLEHIEFNPYGLYGEYLEKLGESDERYKSLYETITVSGDLPLVFSIFNNPGRKFDVSKYDGRLLATVVILNSRTVIQLYEAYLEKESRQ